jgi:hypothetical protein
MAIYETFSKRQKQLLNHGKPDVYRYDLFPEALRVQIRNLLVQNLGAYYTEGRRNDDAARRWSRIHETLSHEYGVFELAEGNNVEAQCLNFFLECQEIDKCLDLVELGFIWIQELARQAAAWGGSYRNKVEQCEQAVKELNYRLREHSVGYQFENSKIICVDSQFIHSEIVKPALSLLHGVRFAGASEEFLQAHEHYRAKRYPEAIAGALKSFESTMKGICDERKWTYPENATAKS